MKNVLFSILFFASFAVHAQRYPSGSSPASDGAIGSPPPSIADFVGAIDSNGHLAGLNLDNTGALKVSTTGGGGGTVNQGTPAALANAWPMKITDGTTAVAVSVANALKVDGSAVTQPISGTVTANAGTNLNTSALALESGGHLASIDSKIPASLTVTATRLLVDGSGVTQPISGSVSVSNFPATQPVSGTVTANQGGAPWSVSQSGIWTVQPGNTANTTPWLMTINQGGNSAAVSASNALKVDGSAVTQPVSGTVTANAGTNLNTSALALESGGHLASIDSKVPANLTVTATRLLVDGSGVTQPVSGTITANQGGAPWSQNITQVGGSSFALGQNTKANSLSVTVASDQGAITTSTTNQVRANDNTGSGAMTASGQTVAVSSFGSGTVTVRVFNTWVGTIVFEATNDGSNYYAVNAVSLTTGNSVTSTTGNDQWIIPSAGTSTVRVRMSAFTSGTASATLDSSTGSNGTYAFQAGIWNINNITGTVSLPTGASTSANQTNGTMKTQVVDGTGAVVGPASTISGTNYLPVIQASSGTPGAAVPVRTTMVAGTDGTNAQTLSVDSSGHLNPNAVTDQTTSGTITALNGTIVLSSMHAMTAVLFQLTGTWTATVIAEASIDGTNWTTVSTAPIPGGVFVTTGATANGLYRGATVAAYTSYRLRASAFTSGTISAVINASSATGTVQAFQFNASNFNAQVVGNVANGAADSGNGVKGAAVFNTTLTGTATGNRTDLQSNQFGELAIVSRNKFLNIHGASAANTIKSGSGRLHSICLNNPASGGVVTVWDNTTNSGTLIATITPGAGTSQIPNCMIFDIEFATGLTTTTTVATNDVTFTYQ